MSPREVSVKCLPVIDKNVKVFSYIAQYPVRQNALHFTP